MENFFYGLSKLGSTKISMDTIKTKFKNFSAKNGWLLNFYISLRISALFGLVFGVFCV